ncbi:MAG: 16S rRNA (cytidine(1402)-2'-O)-methyltransferase [Candidatus Moranbacteria bacterium RIFOXYA12_FULL_35_19]|nr:MAG: Ribosomal RNA small subunit methyltransferase I [Candidatus Moranbacteria bacterium GW2011_GWF2_35_39]OGI30957.1 MAG: 16S rRNA (cytidine(1402)-2'-O)-methyltransferase [Candidatus Moranbacteria bacterium RIFOXYB12_FULL_35_8]OGI35756.1 MAG: 16S rRNA (cytidine(1402)-2'-O)-methyltransferase [Candidatus Moranbacteria bacterium RIFOXYA12_FULL_35_19]
MNSGILYIIATPIGNLSDVTFRAVETLQKVDLIVCEDTRNSKKLLDRYEISTPTMSFYQNLKSGGSIKPVPKLNLIIQELKSGKNLALITDAGTPGISDPGNQLVASAVENNIAVIPIPGVSALTTLASVSGIDLTQFVFLGFPPHKKGRMSFIKKITESEYPVILFESKYRIMKLIADLADFGGSNGGEKINIIIGRELTKMFEEIIRGSAEKVLDYLKTDDNKQKGEFVVITYKEK